MKINFEYVTALQYEVKALQAKIKAYESGEAYRIQREEYEKKLREKDRIIRSQKEEIFRLHQEIVTVRKNWMQVFEDLEKEHKKALSKEKAGRTRMMARALKAEADRDKWHDKWKEQQAALYAALTEAEELKELNRKLTAQVNRDFENSSIPSSMQGAKRKKIPNTRVKTERKPGGQPGHKGHCRKKHVPTETHELPTPPQYINNPDYYETGKIIRKQNVVIQMSAKIIEYTAKEYRNRRTGARVHASFPEGYRNEVNYDGTVKGLAFLLSNECNVSHGKIRKLIEELTKGEIKLSDGMINGLAREFSAKTREEKKEIITQLMQSPVMNADFTNARVNGQTAQVLILASPTADVALYIGREKKGHKGIEGTPLESYTGTVVHDHDQTFYRYGTKHQECIQHDCRYLIGSEQNEPGLKWNKEMHELFREMLHYRNCLGEDDLDLSVVEGFEKRYDEILNKAEEEYTDEPPTDYYREGYNLFLRLRKYKKSELLFLHDKRVPSNNSLCERLARGYKRKQKQAITLRSQDSLNVICDGMSIVYLLRSQNMDVYEKISEIYGRKCPPKIKQEKVAAKT